MFLPLPNVSRNKPVHIVATLLVGMVLLGSLLCSKLFIYPSLSAYFLFAITVAVLALFAAVALLLNKLQLIVSLPILIFLLLLVYAFGNGLFSGYPVNQQHIYMLVCGLLLFSATIIFQLPGYMPAHFFSVLALLAAMQSVFCILQYAGYTYTLNTYFEVTGTWSNPNVTAMFLAMVWPAVGYFALNDRSKQKQAAAVLALIFIALALLKCRTAYIGIAVSSLLLLDHRYQWQVRMRKNKAAALLVVVIVSAALMPIGNSLYQSKKASAQGRGLIWQLSAGMLKEKPLLGYGYGSFERDFNKAQAAYFKGHQVTTVELQTAGFVRMAYNELLQNAVEGGIVGLLLFAAFFASLLFTKGKPVATGNASPERQVAHAAIAACAVMGLVNFTVQAIPAMALALMYSAMLSVQAGIKYSWQLSLLVKPVLAATLMLSGILLCYREVGEAAAHVRNKQAADLLRSGQQAKARQILQGLGTVLNGSESYWRNRGNYAFAVKQYREALASYETAKLYSSDPEIYSQAGLCCQLTGNLKAAEENYCLARDIEPGKLQHRMALMRLYQQAGSFRAAYNMAQQVLGLSPKIPSQKARRYKNEAARLLIKYAAYDPKPFSGSSLVSHANPFATLSQ